jgi:hypothetical protein
MRSRIRGRASSICGLAADSSVASVAEGATEIADDVGLTSMSLSFRGFLAGASTLANYQSFYAVLHLQPIGVFSVRRTRSSSLESIALLAFIGAL